MRLLVLAAVVVTACADSHEPVPECCLPDGVCVPQGARDPANPCLACDPHLSAGAYSAVWDPACSSAPVRIELPPEVSAHEIKWIPDVDGDSLADLALLGDGTFLVIPGATREVRVHRLPEELGYALGLSASDFDGDGVADIAFSTRLPSPVGISGEAVLAISAHSGAVLREWRSAPGDCRETRVLASPDLTGDGLGDVVVLFTADDECGPNALAVWSPASGEMRELLDIPGRWDDTSFTVVDDRDGDGRADIVYLIAGSEPVVISSRDGSTLGSWPVEAGEHAVVIRAFTSVRSAAVDRLEALVGLLPEGVPFDEHYPAHIFYRWTHAGRVSGAAVRGWPAVPAPDLDGDGHPDVLVQRDAFIDLVDGFAGTRVVSFTTPALDRRDFDARGDADGDGRADVAVLDIDENAIYVFYSSLRRP